MTYGINGIGMIAGTKTAASLMIPGAAALLAGGAILAWLAHKQKITTLDNEAVELRQQRDDVRKEKQDLSEKISQLKERSDSKQTMGSDNPIFVKQDDVDKGKQAIFKSIFYDNIQLKTNISETTNT